MMAKVFIVIYVVVWSFVAIDAIRSAIRAYKNNNIKSLIVNLFILLLITR